MIYHAELLTRDFRLVMRVHFISDFFPTVIERDGKTYGEPKISKDNEWWRYVEGNFVVKL